MKYQLIGENDYFLNPIKAILNNRGIDDIDSFLNVNSSAVNDWRLLNNIEKAADCLLDHVSNGSKIFIQCDSDPDGLTSSAILINYLKKNFPKVNIQWRLQEGKEHGVIVDKVPSDVQLVIIPDAGSNQYKEHRQLQERGIETIVLDHHECEKESKYAIVVNNQLSPEYPTKSLTGAAIVYKFLKALDDKLNISHADHYLDLVSVGLIADMADSRELETRYYMLKGLKQIKNTFLKALFDKQSYSTKGIINIVNSQFYIVPLINAAIRTGSLEEKRNMFKAFLEEKEVIFNTRKKESEPIAEAMARILTNLKAKQGRIRDKGVEAIEGRIKEKSLLDNKILIVNVTDILDKNLTGLVANQLCKKYKRPVLMIRHKKGNTFGGSARGYEKGAIKNLREFLIETGKFNFCEGHSNAHGIEIEGSKLIELNELINEQLKDVEIDVSVYDVDFIIPSSQLNINIIKDIHKLKDIWGYKVEEPLLAISNITVNKEDVQVIGAKKNTLKFIHKGIEFVKFNTSEEEINERFKTGEAFEIDVVGKCSVNEWNGNVTGQILIEEYEVVKVKEKEFIF